MPIFAVISLSGILSPVKRRVTLTLDKILNSYLIYSDVRTMMLLFLIDTKTISPV